IARNWPKTEKTRLTHFACSPGRAQLSPALRAALKRSKRHAIASRARGPLRAARATRVGLENRSKLAQNCAKRISRISRAPPSARSFPRPCAQLQSVPNSTQLLRGHGGCFAQRGQRASGSKTARNWPKSAQTH